MNIILLLIIACERHNIIINGTHACECHDILYMGFMRASASEHAYAFDPSVCEGKVIRTRHS